MSEVASHSTTPNDTDADGISGCHFLQESTTRSHWHRVVQLILDLSVQTGEYMFVYTMFSDYKFTKTIIYTLHIFGHLVFMGLNTYGIINNNSSKASIYQ